MIETGSSAVPALRRMLGEMRSAPLFGSKEYMLSKQYKYRLCDYALFFLKRIEGDAQFTLPTKSEERDTLIKQRRTAKDKNADYRSRGLAISLEIWPSVSNSGWFDHLPGLPYCYRRRSAALSVKPANECLRCILNGAPPDWRTSTHATPPPQMFTRAGGADRRRDGRRSLREAASLCPPRARALRDRR